MLKPSSIELCVTVKPGSTTEEVAAELCQLADTMGFKLKLRELRASVVQSSFCLRRDFSRSSPAFVRG